MVAYILNMTFSFFYTPNYNIMPNSVEYQYNALSYYNTAKYIHIELKDGRKLLINNKTVIEKTIKILKRELIKVINE